MLSDRCPVCLSVLRVTLVHFGQTVGWIKIPLVLDTDPAALTKKGYNSPHFSNLRAQTLPALV